MNHRLLKLCLLGVANLCFLLLISSSSLSEEGINGKTLILYYSLTGNTKAGCEALQKELGASIVEIKDLKKRSGKWGFFKTAIGSLVGKHTKLNLKNLISAVIKISYLDLPSGPAS